MWSVFSYTKVPKKSLSDAAKRYRREHANPLFAAIDNKEVAIFRELVEYDPQKARSVTGRSNVPALYETFHYRNLEMTRILLENGAYSDAVIPFLEPPRLLIVEAVAVSRMDFINLLIQYGAPVDKEVGGLSVRKILDNPGRYVKLLFDGQEQSEGAIKFLAKAQEMKQLIEKLVPRSTVIDEIPVMPVYSSISSAIGQLRQRSLAPSALAATSTPSPAIPAI